MQTNTDCTSPCLYDRSVAANATPFPLHGKTGQATCGSPPIAEGRATNGCSPFSAGIKPKRTKERPVTLHGFRDDNRMRSEVFCGKQASAFPERTTNRRGRDHTDGRGKKQLGGLMRQGIRHWKTSRLQTIKRNGASMTGCRRICHEQAIVSSSAMLRLGCRWKTTDSTDLYRYFCGN